MIENDRAFLETTDVTTCHVISCTNHRFSRILKKRIHSRYKHLRKFTCSIIHFMEQKTRSTLRDRFAQDVRN